MSFLVKLTLGILVFSALCLPATAAMVQKIDEGSNWDREILARNKYTTKPDMCEPNGAGNWGAFANKGLINWRSF